MDTLPLSIANGWASGISAYGVLLIAGVLGRGGDAAPPPPQPTPRTPYSGPMS